MKDLKLAGTGQRSRRRTEHRPVLQHTGLDNRPRIIARRSQQLHGSLLMNVMPQQWEIPAGTVMNAPAMIREGVPMRELAARPDVRAAERGVAVAYYSTNSARAAFYPGINISANGGFTNLLGSFISNPGDWFVQLAGSLTAPLFARGQNIARLEAAQGPAAAGHEQLRVHPDERQRRGEQRHDRVRQERGKNSPCSPLQVENLEKSVEYTQELLTLGQRPILKSSPHSRTCSERRCRSWHASTARTRRDQPVPVARRRPLTPAQADSNGNKQPLNPKEP